MSMVYSWQQSEHFAPTSLSFCCPRCEFSLTFHQPDPDLPDRLLATCDECKSWFLANNDGTILVPVSKLPKSINPTEKDQDRRFPRRGL
jgi:hypothetical protein